MNFKRCEIEGLIVIEPRVFGDERGYFFESFNKTTFEKELGEKIDFIQDNESYSKKGTLRGLHYQKKPFAQAKLVRVINGEVLDVAVDLREESPTYGQHYSIILSGENKKQFFVPRGFAHAFLVLSETAVFAYKVDNSYAPDHDAGISYNDPEINIHWPIENSKLIISEKDKNLLSYSEYIENPQF